MDFLRFLLVLLVPGIIGALAFSIAARFSTEINPYVALILNLITFTTMITGLYYLKNIYTIPEMVASMDCLSFTRKYTLLSTAINIFYGVVGGILRRVFFWLRR